MTLAVIPPVSGSDQCENSLTIIMAVAAPTTTSVLLELGLEESDTLVKYMKARRMQSLEVFRLTGNR